MLQFFIQFIKHPRTIGAIAPSGKALAAKMMEPIRFEHAGCIVEYGPGTGTFTRELIRRKKEDTKLLVIEQNEVFHQRLKREFAGEKGVYLIQGSAENVNEYLAQYGIQTADYIVSGLPFTSLPESISKSVFQATRQAIGQTGRFITFQYSLLKQKFFMEYFVMTGRLLEFKNLPPAYVLVMRTK